MIIRGAFEVGRDGQLAIVVRPPCHPSHRKGSMEGVDGLAWNVFTAARYCDVPYLKRYQFNAAPLKLVVEITLTVRSRPPLANHPLPFESPSVLGAVLEKPPSSSKRPDPTP